MASGLQPVWMHCVRAGIRFRSYDLPVPIPVDPTRTRPPSDEELIAEAKGNLLNEHLASPSFEGITFEVIRG